MSAKTKLGFVQFLQAYKKTVYFFGIMCYNTVDINREKTKE